LKTLNLADNSLGDLEPKVFQMLTKLKCLDLSRNPLEDLQPDIFKDVIVSGDNRSFPFFPPILTSAIEISFPKDLKVLKCRGCRLQNINPQLYNLLNQLTELDLGNNQVKVHTR
jgi:Leucine-rich repeat (LRR) protein